MNQQPRKRKPGGGRKPGSIYIHRVEVLVDLETKDHLSNLRKQSDYIRQAIKEKREREKL